MFVNQNSFSDVLYFYQKKIGSYDQPQWEKSVEERVLNGINLNVTKKVNKLKNSLIDLDYIRGTAFNKTKPKQSWLTTVYYGIIRVICLPFYWNWWIDQTNLMISSILLTLYILQLCSMFIYFSNDQFYDKKYQNQAIPPSEPLTPLFMFFFLGILYSQIFASSSNHFPNRNKSYLNQVGSTKLDEKLDEKQPNLSKFDLKDERSYNSEIVSKQQVTKKLITNNNPKFNNNKLNKSRLKFKTCSTRARSTLRTNKNELNKRKRHLTTNDSLTEIQLAKLEQEQKLIINKSDNVLDKKKDLEDIKLIDLNDNKLTDHKIEQKSKHLSTHQDEQDLNNLHNLKDLQIKVEQSNYLDEISTSEDCSPYSSISSSTNLKLLLNSKPKESNKKETDLELNTSNTNPNYFEQHIFQPQKTKYYYFKEVVSDKDNSKISYAYDEEQTNFKRKINNDDSNCSENGSISPTSPMKSLNDWPMINSDNSTEDDEEEEVLIATVEQQKPIPDKQSSESNEDCLHNDHKRLNSLTNKNLNLFPDDSIDKISCTIYQEKEWQKINLSMIDISSMIIKKVDTVRYSNEYFYFAILFSLLFAFIPQIFRFQQFCTNLNNTDFQSNTISLSSLAVNKHLMNCDQTDLNILDAYGLRKNESEECKILKNNSDQKTAFEEFIEYFSYLPVLVFDLLVDVFKNSIYTFPISMKFIVFVALIERFTLSLLFFILLCVAERTFRERFLYAKYFCHLTSARRAKRNELPHFRLNKVQNIKSWLSIRSFLKKHGPQRSVDSIVSTSFILAISLLTFLSIQLLRESEVFSESLYCYEMIVWNLAIGIFIMRLIILGSKMNRKYKSNLSVLITEQINLYLQLEQKPHKKEKLQLANNVLKLAADLLKQLEVPFKISGFSANPYLYNITKVVLLLVLSAFSAVLSEVLGFKLKLYKIKISP